MQLPILTPAGAARLARTATRSALDNARAAGESLSLAIADRATVAPQEPSAAAPGDLAVIPERECLELLRRRSVGRLAYMARLGVPDIAPVNYVVAGRDILVRSGPGPKLQAAERREVVAFEVDDVDEDARTGWSVVVIGRATALGAAEQARLDLPVPWANGVRRHVLRIRAARITGRRIA